MTSSRSLNLGNCLESWRVIKKPMWEFLLWYSGNESDQYPRGCRFNPCSCSVGQGSSVVVSFLDCGIGWQLQSENFHMLQIQPEKRKKKKTKKEKRKESPRGQMLRSMVLSFERRVQGGQDLGFTLRQRAIGSFCL